MAQQIIVPTDQPTIQDAIDNITDAECTIYIKSTSGPYSLGTNYLIFGASQANKTITIEGYTDTPGDNGVAVITTQHTSYGALHVTGACSNSTITFRNLTIEPSADISSSKLINLQAEITYNIENCTIGNLTYDTDHAIRLFWSIPNAVLNITDSQILSQGPVAVIYESTLNATNSNFQGGRFDRNNSGGSMNFNDCTISLNDFMGIDTECPITLTDCTVSNSTPYTLGSTINIKDTSATISGGTYSSDKSFLLTSGTCGNISVTNATIQAPIKLSDSAEDITISDNTIDISDTFHVDDGFVHTSSGFSCNSITIENNSGTISADAYGIKLVYGSGATAVIKNNNISFGSSATGHAIQVGAEDLATISGQEWGDIKIENNTLQHDGSEESAAFLLGAGVGHSGALTVMNNTVNGGFGYGIQTKCQNGFIKNNKIRSKRPCSISGCTDVSITYNSFYAEYIDPIGYAVRIKSNDDGTASDNNRIRRNVFWIPQGYAALIIENAPNNNIMDYNLIGGDQIDDLTRTPGAFYSTLAEIWAATGGLTTNSTHSIVIDHDPFINAISGYWDLKIPYRNPENKNNDWGAVLSTHPTYNLGAARKSLRLPLDINSDTGALDSQLDIATTAASVGYDEVFMYFSVGWNFWTTYYNSDSWKSRFFKAVQHINDLGMNIVMPTIHPNSLYIFDRTTSAAHKHTCLYQVNGTTASFVADPTDPAEIVNGDFETGDFSGYYFLDDNWTIGSAAEAYEGSYCAKGQYVDESYDISNRLMISQYFTVNPWTQYYLSFYLKTDNVNPNKFFLYLWKYEDSTLIRSILSCYDFDIESTQDWTKYSFAFNSQDSSTVSLRMGFWPESGPGTGYEGYVYVDKIEVNQAGLLNVIRRDSCPLTVTDGITEFEEGVHFGEIRDDIFMDNWPVEWSSHAEPTFEILDSTAIPDGTSLTVTAYCAALYNDHPITELTLFEEFRDRYYDFQVRLDSVIAESGVEINHFLMGLDEHRTGGGDTVYHYMTAAQVVGDFVNATYEGIKKANENHQVVMWNDMLDDYHNAVENYYSFYGDMSGALDFVEYRDIQWYNWNNKDYESWTNSYDFFRKRGHGKIILTSYNTNGDLLASVLPDVKNTMGMGYFTWSGGWAELSLQTVYDQAKNNWNNSLWQVCCDLAAKGPESVNTTGGYTKNLILWIETKNYTDQQIISAITEWKNKVHNTVAVVLENNNLSLLETIINSVPDVNIIPGINISSISYTNHGLDSTTTWSGIVSGISDILMYMPDTTKIILDGKEAMNHQEDGFESSYSYPDGSGPLSIDNIINGLQTLPDLHYYWRPSVAGSGTVLERYLTVNRELENNISVTFIDDYMLRSPSSYNTDETVHAVSKLQETVTSSINMISSTDDSSSYDTLSIASESEKAYSEDVFVYTGSKSLNEFAEYIYYPIYYQKIANNYGFIYNRSADYNTYMQQAFDVVLGFSEEEKKDLLFPFKKAKDDTIPPISEAGISAIRALQVATITSSGLSIEDFIRINNIQITEEFAAISTAAGFPINANV